ncbi:hypothetical protein B0J17DRAFT_721807 [Rhizoctonia solani]|nr:hypothetical protein B0J17DRAFT_721807 [Rhizoctonia solani]
MNHTRGFDISTEASRSASVSPTPESDSPSPNTRTIRPLPLQLCGKHNHIREREEKDRIDCGEVERLIQRLPFKISLQPAETTTLSPTKAYVKGVSLEYETPLESRQASVSTGQTSSDKPIPVSLVLLPHSPALTPIIAPTPTTLHSLELSLLLEAVDELEQTTASSPVPSTGLALLAAPHPALDEPIPHILIELSNPRDAFEALLANDSTPWRSFHRFRSRLSQRCAPFQIVFHGLIISLLDHTLVKDPDATLTVVRPTHSTDITPVPTLTAPTHPPSAPPHTSTTPILPFQPATLDTPTTTDLTAKAPIVAARPDLVVAITTRRPSKVALCSISSLIELLGGITIQEVVEHEMEKLEKDVEVLPSVDTTTEWIKELELEMWVSVSEMERWSTSDSSSEYT